jgi:hypothetical protein
VYIEICPNRVIQRCDEIYNFKRRAPQDGTPLTAFERDVLRKAKQESRDVDLDKPFEDNGMTPSEGIRYIPLVEESIQRHHSSMRALSKRLRQIGFYRFLDLVNNQPQWSLAAKYRARDELIGADDFNVTLAHEQGWPNVNKYRAHRAVAATRNPRSTVWRVTWCATMSLPRCMNHSA